MKEKVSFVTGSNETKNMKDLLPNIMRQLGPKQITFIKDYAEQLKKDTDKTTEKVDEAPELVEDFEEIAKQD